MELLTPKPPSLAQSEEMLRSLARGSYLLPEEARAVEIVLKALRTQALELTDTIHTLGVVVRRTVEITKLGMPQPTLPRSRSRMLGAKGPKGGRTPRKHQ